MDISLEYKIEHTLLLLLYVIIHCFFLLGDDTNQKERAVDVLIITLSEWETSFSQVIHSFWNFARCGEYVNKDLHFSGKGLKMHMS